MSEERISAGSYDLNKWLRGGYERGIITMIVGPPGSGKTNFCILAACSQAKKANKVLFIDTEGGFSIERIKQIAPNDSEIILRNILILEPTNFLEQSKIFSELSSKIKKEHFSLIVIDGMAMFYRLELGDAITLQDDNKIREVNKEVAKQMNLLSGIARKQKIPVIITNQVYTGFLSREELEKGAQRQVNIVGGDLFKYWSKCIIELKNDSGKKRAILLKHRSIKDKELAFEIRERGIFKRGWI